MRMPIASMFFFHSSSAGARRRVGRRALRRASAACRRASRDSRRRRGPCSRTCRAARARPPGRKSRWRAIVGSWPYSAGGTGCDRRHRLAVRAADVIAAVAVVAHADRAAQRDLFRRVAADDRVVQVEKEERERRLDLPVQRDAALREARLEPVAVEHVGGKRRRHAGRSRACPLSNASSRGCASSMIADVDVARRAAAACRRVPWRSPRRRHRRPAAPDSASSRKSGFASSTIFWPRVHYFSRYGPGADRVLHHAVRRVAVLLDDLARDRREVARREPPLEAVIGLA